MHERRDKEKDRIISRENEELREWQKLFIGDSKPADEKDGGDFDVLKEKAAADSTVEHRAIVTEESVRAAEEAVIKKALEENRQSKEKEALKKVQEARYRDSLKQNHEIEREVELKKEKAKQELEDAKRRLSEKTYRKQIAINRADKYQEIIERAKTINAKERKGPKPKEEPKGEVKAKKPSLTREQKERKNQALINTVRKGKRAQREADRKRRLEERAAVKAAKKEAAKKKKAEMMAKKLAEEGVGTVSVHGVNVSTELHIGARLSKDVIKELLSKKNRSRETVEAVKEAASYLLRFRWLKRKEKGQSKLRKRFEAIVDFCEERRKGLLVTFSIVLLAIVGTAGVINYYTIYEYSYNGRVLGYVNNKDDVLQITSLVQSALSDDTNMKIVIDARDDITFERVANVGGAHTPDSSETVLKRLTYMGNLNVKAYGIYVNGKKIGAVENNEAAANVLQTIKDKYASGLEGSKVESAVILENIEIKQSNTNVQEIMTEDEMVDTLCTSGEKEILHTVVAGETLADIAKDYALTEKDITAVNPDVNPKRLNVGSTIIIKQNAPVLTVKITEKRTYDKVIEYEVIEKKDKDLYEGYTEIDQKGVDGVSHVTERTVTVNGEPVEVDTLKAKVKSDPVAKIVRVGTKDRPPTVGSGTYIWPTDGSFRISSRFGPRWGRNHDGIDMACSTGTNVLASDGGTVTEAGYHGSYGLLVVVNHQNGVETYYAHNSKLIVKKGDKVFQGQHIAESGSTGRSTGPHIHFGVKVNGVFKNPENYLP